MRPAANPLVLCGMVQPRAERIDLALGSLETITQGQHHVGMRMVTVGFVRGDDGLVAGNADLYSNVKELRTGRPPCRRFDDDAGVRKSIEMALQPFELFADASFNRIASLEAVKRDLEWCQHSRTLSW